MIILASHGDYAFETLKSCEMITGHLENFQTVSFHDPMSIDDLVAKYKNIYDEYKEQDSSFSIIVDIPNGTPANAALFFMEKYPGIQLYAGLSFMLVLSIATGTTIDSSIEQVKEMSFKVKGEKVTTNFVEDKENDGKIDTEGDLEANPIANIRVDARLIHGQVATMWTRELSVTRIMVIDDQIVKSDVQKATLKNAVPGGIHLSILTVKGAAQRIKKGQYAGQRVFIIVKHPDILSKLLEEGVSFNEINIGNMSMTEGARQIAKSVAVTADDIELLKRLSEKGVRVYHQMVPNDKQEDFVSMIKERM